MSSFICVINETLETPKACFDLSGQFVHIKQLQRKTGSDSQCMFFHAQHGKIKVYKIIH